MEGLMGKNALVTGGSSGIGQAIAIRLSREGANVAVNYLRDVNQAEETQELIQHAIEDSAHVIEGHGHRCLLVQADVSSEEEIDAMVRRTIDELGGIDIVVNNAGIQIGGASDEATVESFDRVLGVNLRGAFITAQRTIRHFLAEDKPGVIINVSSVHEVIPKPRFLSYSVSKGGMQNLTRTLALEYARRKIRVNGIAPGATVTPINRAWIDDPEKRVEVESHIPMGRAAEAEEMGAVTAFLCSDDAAYVTGQTIFVDGGLTLYPDFRTAWSSE
jgi:glucose 1-dehydrogenase